MAGTTDSGFAVYFADRVAGLRRAAYLLTGNWHDAEDVVQAAFVRLYGVWHRVRRDTADAYLRKVMINVFLSSKRGQPAREHPVPDLPDLPAAQPVADDRLVLRHALAALTPHQRAVVVLRYWDGLSVAETAAALGISQGTVKSQLHRAVHALRPYLSEDRGVR
ncbi:MAG TPA: SigE family RNA polymerase sigma factor [Actinophytocola sp.]|uniref:SigE family RNA polymerase sigma factor n=1 Tax=Actinophytocola sp. TaxID=1872138 RepID=UPI002DB9522A|nr:SigE family RNA polymerase sigma factor [Actinophytocola sp.]HEU5471415.1 SigE family RNA polymerase sigma factor [Actinophytocola sp.]